MWLGYAMKKKLKAAGVIAVVIILGVVVYMTFVSNMVFIKDKTLKSFSTSSGGGMSGGYSSETISTDGDYALIRTEKADWHNDDPEINEYAVDKAVLSEINDIFWKYHMKRWNNKKFTNIFVADGESTSYDFGFAEKGVRFSSQIYPASVSEKLNEIDEVVNKYIETSKDLSNPAKQ